MAMLDRYRKAGGFNQLLLLIETCGAAKQEKFLEIVKKEDEVWAEEIRAKMIDLKRIFTWNDDTLTEIFGTLQDLTVAIVLHDCNDEQREKIRKFFTNSRWRKVDDLFKSSKPSPGEIVAMQMKIIESVRHMAIEGSLRFSKFAPELEVSDEIEAQLAHRAHEKAHAAEGSYSSSESGEALSFGKFDTHPSAGSAENTPASAAPGADDGRLVELQTLKKRVNDMSKEIATLRHDLSVAKTKLEQIRKIA